MITRAKNYENAHINDNKSYLPYDNYPRVLSKISRVKAGNGEVSGAKDAQRVRPLLSKSHAQSMHRTKKMKKREECAMGRFFSRALFFARTLPCERRTL
jgi:hypothetical protein